jgi:Family of unknown function (DUF6065)
MASLRSRPRVEFLCAPEDKGVIAEPVPARTALPAWYARLPGIDHEQLSATNNGLTVKRCLPFLDAMTVGWLLPLAATVRLDVSDGGRQVAAGWEFDREMVSTHAAFQAAGNPYEPRPVMKFHNPWAIRTPAGWSCLFVPPLNRPDAAFEVLSGVVDTDRYVAPVNLPFVATAEDGVHTLAKGTPLAQVIPFRRDAVAPEGVVRAEREDEADERERVHRSTLAGARWYARNARAKR